MSCLALSFTKRVEIGGASGFPLGKDSTVATIAKEVQLAEFFQLFFFGSQALLYGLALKGYISPMVPGITTLGLLPLQATAYHRSMILYGPRSRTGLTLIALICLSAVALLSIKKIPGDYAFTLCGGGFLVHIVRLVCERRDYLSKQVQKSQYQSQPHNAPCIPSFFIDRVHRAKHVNPSEFLDCDEKAIPEVAKKIQAAEIFQLLYFTALTVLFGLTLMGRVKPLVSGICTLSLLPFQVYANYKTMVLYGPKSRLYLTATVAISMALMGTFSVLGKPGDFTWMLCLGNLLFHAIRLITERRDYQKFLETEKSL